MGDGGMGEGRGGSYFFPTQNVKLPSNQNETFSTCSPIMSASFVVNWKTSSFLIYALLIMKLKFEIKNCNFLTNFVLISSFRSHS